MAIGSVAARIGLLQSPFDVPAPSVPPPAALVPPDVPAIGTATTSFAGMLASALDATPAGGTPSASERATGATASGASAANADAVSFMPETGGARGPFAALTGAAPVASATGATPLAPVAGAARPATAPGSSAGAFPNLTGDLDASPEVLTRLDRLAAARGERWTVTSGLRTDAEQARLWADRANNPYPVARPGTSIHRTGNGADVTIDGRAIQDVISAGELRAAGLEPLAGDAVHVQLAGTLP